MRVEPSLTVCLNSGSSLCEGRANLMAVAGGIRGPPGLWRGALRVKRKKKKKRDRAKRASDELGWMGQV